MGVKEGYPCPPGMVRFIIIYLSCYAPYTTQTPCYTPIRCWWYPVTPPPKPRGWGGRSPAAGRGTGRQDIFMHGFLLPNKGRSHLLLYHTKAIRKITFLNLRIILIFKSYLTYYTHFTKLKCKPIPTNKFTFLPSLHT